MSDEKTSKDVQGQAGQPVQPAEDAVDNETSTHFGEEFKPQESSGLTSLQSAYNSREVSLPMLLVGAITIAALAGILVALTFFA